MASEERAVSSGPGLQEVRRESVVRKAQAPSWPC